jgi:hypothetical protein
MKPSLNIKNLFELHDQGPILLADVTEKAASVRY